VIHTPSRGILSKYCTWSEKITKLAKQKKIQLEEVVIIKKTVRSDRDENESVQGKWFE